MCGCGGASSSGGGSGGPFLAPTAAPAPSLSPAGYTGDDWNTLGHDMQRTGYDTLPNPITKSTAANLKLRWSYTFPNDSPNGAQTQFFASPIVVNGIVYVLPIDDKLAAFDAKTGAMLWQTTLVPQQPEAAAFLTPSLYDGLLFAGTYTVPGVLVAVDPVTHNVIWQSSAPPGALRSAPIAVNGNVFVGSADGDAPDCTPGGVYAYNEQSGQGATDWLTSPTAADSGFTDGGAVWGPITFTGSSIVFGTGNTCFNNSPNGDAIVSTTIAQSTQWAVKTESDSSAGDDDVGSGVLDVGGVGYASAKNGWLYAINLSSGKLLWSESLGAPDGYGGFAMPGYVDGTLFASRGFTTNPYATTLANPGGMLFGLTPQGQIKWSIASNSILLGQVVGVNDVAFAEIDNSINAVDPATGNILWTYATQGDFESSPAIVPSGLFVTDLSGTIYAFGLPSQGKPSGSRIATNAGARSLPKAIKGETRFPVPLWKSSNRFRVDHGDVTGDYYIHR